MFPPLNSNVDDDKSSNDFLTFYGDVANVVDLPKNKVVFVLFEKGLQTLLRPEFFLKFLDNHNSNHAIYFLQVRRRALKFVRT
jgi:hypothetical protein